MNDVDETIRSAQSGDRTALEAVIRQIQPHVYSLALRMLWHPEDARDATQEILLRVVTHLGSFRGESKVHTWVYRIAINHLLDWRKSRMEKRAFTFESFGKDLEEGLVDRTCSPDEAVLLQEIRVGCTLGMLLCLDRTHRAAYVLGEILDLDSTEAAAILKVNQTTFRKRLERARAEIVRFMKERCGLTNSHNACRCHRRLLRALELKRVERERLLFAGDLKTARAFPDVVRHIRNMEETQRAVALFRSHPEYTLPDFTAGVMELLSSSNALRGAFK